MFQARNSADPASQGLTRVKSRDASASKNCLRIHTCSLTHRHRHKKTRSERFIHHPGHHHHHIHLLFIIYMHIHCKKPLPLFSNTLMRCTFTCWATCPQSSFNSKSSHIFPVFFLMYFKSVLIHHLIITVDKSEMLY